MKSKKILTIKLLKKFRLILTNEALLFVNKFSSINMDFDTLSKKEKLIKFKTWLHFVKIFYKNLVIEIYHQIVF